MNDNCTVLVASCDKYADLLGPFSTLWRKFWPDCPFKVVLVTESEPANATELCFDRVVACGAGGNWCSRLVQALDTIGTTYVLMLCDDYYLEKPVQTARILERLAQAKAFDAANLRLIPNPKPSIPYRDGLMEYRKQTAYCIATQAGIWNREFLRGHLGVRAARKFCGGGREATAPRHAGKGVPVRRCGPQGLLGEVRPRRVPRERH